MRETLGLRLEEDSQLSVTNVKVWNVPRNLIYIRIWQTLAFCEANRL